ncbi:LADA_0H08042g1_1 [Lachancea dasiensis]|uniref:LADA_0H08042g1_1 n=1 Tax=Lachancea dasiensis TaxID=1072105 RepID=A0A1G4K2E7_9SACH|nr:LADA_0H08042g1_1 [Lachancea dasiensis]
MGRPSARFSGMIPSDNLTGAARSKNTEPTRYTTQRRDDKIRHEINHNLERTFLFSGQLARTASISPLSSNGMRSSGKRSMVLNDGDTSDVDNSRADLPTGIEFKSKRPRFIGSPLEALDESDCDPLQRPYQCSLNGTFQAFHNSGGQSFKNHAVMKFLSDKDQISMHIRWKGQSIEGTEVNFLVDCKKVYFSQQERHLGLVLKHPRILNLGSDDGISVFLWSALRDEIRLSDIRERIRYRLVDHQIVDDHGTGGDALVRLMKSDAKNHRDATYEMTLPDQQNTNIQKSRSRAKSFTDKDLKSLRRHRTKSHSNASGERISKPDESNVRNTHTTPTHQFYGSQNQPFQNSLMKHALSSTKRITRSETINTSPEASPPTELSLDHEIPETFKPSLFYKFDDNTTLSVSNQDFKCLYNHDWINDSILDFFIKYWAEASIKKQIISRNQIHVLSSFFYTKLVSNTDSYYENVRKWVRDTDLFTKDYVVMPINESFHWFGCIITNLPALLSFLVQERTFNSKNPPESQNGESQNSDEISITSPVVSIMVYDSLRQTHSREVEPIKEFLIAYASDKYDLELSKNQIKMKTCMVPQQPNMSDCGVHVILNTRTFFEMPKKTIGLWWESKLRNKASSRVVNEYFNKRDRTNARFELREVLWKLQEKQVELNRTKGIFGDESNSNDDERHSDIEILEDYVEPMANDDNESEKNNISEPAPKALDLLSNVPLASANFPDLAHSACDVASTPDKRERTCNEHTKNLTPKEPILSLTNLKYENPGNKSPHSSPYSNILKSSAKLGREDVSNKSYADTTAPEEQAPFGPSIQTLATGSIRSADANEGIASENLPKSINHSCGYPFVSSEKKIDAHIGDYESDRIVISPSAENDEEVGLVEEKSYRKPRKPQQSENIPVLKAVQPQSDSDGVEFEEVGELDGSSDDGSGIDHGIPVRYLKKGGLQASESLSSGPPIHKFRNKPNY